MSTVIKWLRNHPFWVGGMLLVLIGLATGGYFGLKVVQASPPQPIQFNHSRHDQAGIQCEYCHTSAGRAANTGLPTISKCMGCHFQMTARTAEMEKVLEYGSSGEPLSWVPVAIQPDFVRFSHQPHISYGLDCEECHGDLTTMTVAEPQPNQNMGWCLDCHQKLVPERFDVLSDCATCHY